MDIKSNVYQSLMNLDHATHYIPVLSSISGAITLAAQNRLIPSTDEYAFYLKRQNKLQLVVSLIPIVGNGFHAWVEWKQWSQKDQFLRKNRFGALYEASYKLINNETFMRSACAIDIRNLQYASLRLRRKEVFVLEMIEKDATAIAIRFVHASIINQKFVKEAVTIRGQSIKHLPQYQDNKAVGLFAVKQDGLALEFLSARLQDDDEIVESALKKPEAIHFASPRIQGLHQRKNEPPAVRLGDEGQWLALIILTSDNYFTIDKSATPESRRFLQMASRLPLDLQRVLSNRVIGSPKEGVSNESFEKAVKDRLCIADIDRL